MRNKSKARHQDSGRKGSRLKQLLREEYSAASLGKIKQFLHRHGTHELHPVAHGLFAATGELESGAVSGYQNAWVRDNVMIANSFRLRGRHDVAKGTAQGLTEHFSSQRGRFEKIIKNPRLKESIQERPHIRFDAKTLLETAEPWPHAQNDALGYALWFRFTMANSKESRYPLGAADWNVYALFPRYFEAIEYWSDPDSGPWEETRKVNNSSVGAVVAGLEQMRDCIAQLRETGEALPPEIDRDLPTRINFLLEKGRDRLKKTLPFESPPERMIDGALLFLIHPVRAVKSRDIQDSILNLVEARLRGPMGIKRYLGDSYFCQDYDKWFPPEQQAADFSNSIEYRDALLHPGCEAQWSLFDPIISIIYGERYHESKQIGDLKNQTFYFNRSLQQLTEDAKCPELYYLRGGQFVANDHTPLAWTQVNQALALHYMEKSLSLR
ncbi:MAG: glycoside hydrolase family 15 protein [Candidatus Acidiferrales bacterium]